MRPVRLCLAMCLLHAPAWAEPTEVELTAHTAPLERATAFFEEAEQLLADDSAR